MALKAIVDKLDDVPEQNRDLYTQKGNKFEFTGVEGLKTQADVDRQLAANQKVRKDLQDANGTIATLKATIEGWGDLKPEEVTAKLEELETLKAAGPGKSAQEIQDTITSRVEQIVAARVKSETTKLERTVAQLTNDLTTAKTLVGQYETQNATRTVHDAIRAEAVKAKVLPEAIPDLLLVAGQELKLVDGKVATEDGRAPEDVITAYKESRPYFWPAAKGAGARGGNGDVATGSNPFARDSWNVTQASQLLRQDPAKAAKLAEAAGVPKNQDGSLMYHVMPPK